MRLFLYILLILMPVSAMAKQTLATTDITDERHLLELLDSYIEKRDVYAKQKEEKLKQLKLRLRTADNNAARLAILDKIYREYYTYRYDSALVYADRGLALSQSDNDLTSPCSTASTVQPCCQRVDSTASRKLF